MRGAVDGATDALIGAAAAEIARHGLIDLVVCRIRMPGEQGGRRHELPALAVAALRDLLRDPRPLQPVAAVPGETLDRSNPLRADGGDRNLAGADGGTGKVNGARPALTDATAEFGAGEPERVAKHPQEWGGGGNVHRPASAVDIDRERGHKTSRGASVPRTADMRGAAYICRQ